MATTIPAGTLRLLLTSIGYRAKARKRDAAEAASGSAPPAALCRWTAPPGGGCQADPVHVEALTPQQVRYV